jgi:exosome complex RNA-binding protein Rrp42 (RNase PH superfamily)
MLRKDISQSEKDYVVKGCNANVRFDGRNNLDFRSWCIENNIFPHLHGSARLRIPHFVDMVASVKLEVTKVDENKPNQGMFEINIEISPSCYIRKDERKVNEIAAQIACHMQR